MPSWKMLWRGGEVGHVVDEAGDRGLFDAAEDLLEQSQRLVPYLTGELSESGEVNEGEGEVAISYNTVYAVKQHEDTMYRHPAGRQAKFLEQPVDEGAREFYGGLAKELRKVMPPVRIPL